MPPKQPQQKDKDAVRRAALRDTFVQENPYFPARDGVVLDRYFPPVNMCRPLLGRRSALEVARARQNNDDDDDEGGAQQKKVTLFYDGEKHKGTGMLAHMKRNGYPETTDAEFRYLQREQSSLRTQRAKDEQVVLDNAQNQMEIDRGFLTNRVCTAIMIVVFAPPPAPPASSLPDTHAFLQCAGFSRPFGRWPLHEEISRYCIPDLDDDGDKQQQGPKRVVLDTCLRRLPGSHQYSVSIPGDGDRLKNVINGLLGREQQFIRRDHIKSFALDGPRLPKMGQQRLDVAEWLGGQRCADKKIRCIQSWMWDWIPDEEDHDQQQQQPGQQQVPLSQVKRVLAAVRAHPVHRVHSLDALEAHFGDSPEGCCMEE